MLIGNSAEAIAWAELARADADAAGDEAPPPGRGSRRRARWSARRSRTEATAAMHDAIDHARRLGDTVLLCRALSNSLELVPPSSAEGRALRGELLEASRLVGIDKLGTSVGLLWEAAAAYDDGDLAALRRAHAEGEQWWGRAERPQLLGARLAGELRVRGGPCRGREGASGSIRRRGRPSPQGAGQGRARAAAGGGGRRLGRAASSRSRRWSAVPAVPDVNSAPNDVVMATEAALAVGVPPARVRAELVERWLGRPPVGGELPRPRRRAPAGGRRRPRGRGRALGAVLDEPEPRLARPAARVAADGAGGLARRHR